MDNFDKICRKIDWEKMAKARKTVKNLALKKPQFKYLANFLDQLADTAIEEHGVSVDVVLPGARHARLIADMRKQEAFDNMTESFFKAQNERRKKEDINRE
jgi:hypothetical protein